MKAKIFMLCVSLVLFTTNMSAQWTVWDPVSYTHLDVYKRQGKGNLFIVVPVLFH